MYRLLLRPNVLPTFPASSHQARTMVSLLHKTNITSPSHDLDTAISIIRTFHPAGYVPGLLVPPEAKMGYFALQSFYVALKLDSADLNRIVPFPTETDVEFWKRGLDGIYTGKTDFRHPTLQLLDHAVKEYKLSRELFDAILNAQTEDVEIAQRVSLQSMITHAEQTQGNILQLMLECLSVPKNEIVMETANNVGVACGITTALRSSIPLASTGKIIIPMDLCERYGVRSPRYLLSLLGQGDASCQLALQKAVQEMATTARIHLAKGREKREEILQQEHGKKVVKCFLPGLAAETFLERLEQSEYSLTNRELREVGMVEHALCGVRMGMAALRNTY